MTRRFSLLIYYGCTAVLIAVPAGALYYLVSIDGFATLAQDNLRMPIQWASVAPWQWYSLWLLTALYVAIGPAGLFYLRRAFRNFSAGELFNLANSQDLRRFSMLLFLQGVAKPMHFTLASVLLSVNHGPGQKVLSFSFGSRELTIIAAAMVFWVISNLLVEGSELQSENRQFV